MALAFEKVRFLVVDEHEAAVQIIKTLLNAIGAKDIAVERSCSSALRRLEQDKIDIAVLDMRLGLEDGLEFLRAIRRSDSRHAFLPVLIVSAHTDQTRVEAARDAGATEVCAKPISPAELCRKLMSMIVEPRPYVQTDGYFGPDRRRHTASDYAGPERRADRLQANEAEREEPVAAVG